jgi:hypothetical protein
VKLLTINKKITINPKFRVHHMDSIERVTTWVQAGKHLRKVVLLACMAGVTIFFQSGKRSIKVKNIRK